MLLHQHIKHGSKQHPSPNYQPLTPNLRLYLANNSLNRVPPEIYRLKSLSVLSLRSNNITSISSSVAHLTNLKELNLSSNRLQYLPYEILPLFNETLEDCFIQPNLFLRPLPSRWRRASPSGSPPSLPDVSTPVAFLDICGASQWGYPPAPTKNPTPLFEYYTNTK